MATATTAIEPNVKISATKLLINGQWVNSTSGKTFPTINPATGVPYSVGTMKMRLLKRLKCTQKFEKLAQAAPVVAVGFFLKADDPGRHRQDAVLTHEADGFAIFVGGLGEVLALEVAGS